MTIDWRHLPWKTIVGVTLILLQAGAYYRAGRMDMAVDALGVAIALIGIRSGVSKDQQATKAISVKVDAAHSAVVDAHAAIARTEAKMDQVVSMSSDSIPVAKPFDPLG